MDIPEAYAALEKAHAAGDAATAQKYADYIRQQQAAGTDKPPTEGVEPVGVGMVDSAAEAISGLFKPQPQQDVSLGEAAGAVGGGAAAGAVGGAVLPGALKAAGKFLPGVAGRAVGGLGEALSAIPVGERAVRGAGGGAAMGATDELGKAFGAPPALTLAAGLAAGGVGEGTASFLHKETGQLLSFVGNLSYGNVAGAARAVRGMLSPNKPLNEAMARKLQEKLFGNPNESYINTLVGSDNRMAAQVAMRKADPSLVPPGASTTTIPDTPTAGLQAAQTNNSFIYDRTDTSKGYGRSIGFPQSANTPADKLFSNFAEAEYKDPAKLERFQEGMFQRANKDPKRFTNDPVQVHEVPFGNGLYARTEATKSGNTRTQILNGNGDVLAASTAQKGMLDSIAVAKGEEKKGLGQALLQYLDKNKIANVREVPDRSPGMVAMQKRLLANEEAETRQANEAMRPASEIYRDRMYNGVTAAVQEGKIFSSTPPFEEFRQRLGVQVTLRNVTPAEAQKLLMTLRADRSKNPLVLEQYAETVDNRIRQWGKAQETGGQTGAAAVSANVSKSIRNDLQRAYNEYTDRLGLGPVEQQYRAAYSTEKIAQAKDELPYFLSGFEPGKEFEKMARNLAQDPQGRPFIQQALATHLAQQEPGKIAGEFERLQKVVVNAGMLQPQELKALRDGAAAVARTADSGARLRAATQLKQMVMLAVTRQAGMAGGRRLGSDDPVDAGGQ